MAEAASPSHVLGATSMDQLLAPSMDESDHLRRLIKGTTSSSKHHEQSPAEEKKVDDETYTDPPNNNTSFERALGEIGNEFDGDFEDDEDFDDANEEEIPRAATTENGGAIETSNSSSLESRRYNDILGLLRNRRQELTAALQRQPSASLKVEEINSDVELLEVETKDTDTTERHGTKSPRTDESEDEEIVRANTDEEDVNQANSKEKSKLEKIDTKPQATEEERRRQQMGSPTRRHPMDLHSLSPTPPRSPHRTLPYFHKPSGVTPPVSPSFVVGAGENSPTGKALPDLSPKKADVNAATSKSEAAIRDLPTLPPLVLSKMQEELTPPRKASSSSLRESASAPKEVPSAARSDPGGGTRIVPPSMRERMRRPDSPKSEIQGQSPFAIPRSSSTPTRKIDAATNAASLAISKSSSPTKSSRKPSPFRSGSLSPKKSAPPDKIRFRDPYPILRPEKQPRDPTDIITEHTNPKEQVPIRWVRPKPDLKQLIVAAMGSSLTRRSNACGALKVLTKSKKNQINLFRTDSFMVSLLYCASQEIPVRERDVALDARTRAVACIKAVCEPKMNRYHVVTFPGLLDCLVKVIQTDNGESRSLACSSLALIAKTSDCREEIVKDYRLVKLLAQVLGNRVPVPSPMKEEKKEEPLASPEPEEHTDEEDEEDDHSEHTGGNGEDSTIGDYDTAFAGSMGMIESFDMLSRANPQSPRPQSDEEAEEATFDDATLGSHTDDSDVDQPAVDSIRKKKLERNQTFVQESRASACAVLLHLSRECPLSPLVCNNHTVLDNMILVANETSNSIHTRCLEFLFNLSRFPANNVKLTPYEGMVGTLLSLGDSQTAEDRLLALQTLQNLSSDQASKPRLAIDTILSFLTSCAVRKDDAEREAAVSTLQNISTEPGAVVAITNTKNAIATLVHLAHSPSTKATTRHLACETLANISLWLQTLAGTGKVPEGVENNLLPTLKTSGWEKWN